MYMSETRLYHNVRECATELVTRHLCMKYYEYVKRFVYVHVTELVCIIGHNVVHVTKHLCMNMS